MSEITEKFKNEIKAKLLAFKADMDEEAFAEQIQWIFDEYKNFMMISRDTYSGTLRNILKMDEYKEFHPMFQLLLDNIEKYGATKAYCWAASDILNSK